MGKKILLFFLLILPCTANAEVNSQKLINDDVIRGIRSFAQKNVVMQSILDQNVRYGSLTQAKIDELDNNWKKEANSDIKPIISATLSNPLSAYLTRIQSQSNGLYNEIFVMDKNGLNVGQSNVTSDYWQGDEDKFKKTCGAGSRTVFVDDAEYDEEMGTWNAQVSMSVMDTEGTPVGAITVEVDLTELMRRNALKEPKPAAAVPVQPAVIETVPAAAQ